MLKRMTMLTRRDDLDRAAFSLYWRTRHAEIARAMPGVRRYLQNHVLASRGMPQPCPLACDGIVELWFNDQEAMERAFASEAGQALPGDERNFLSGITILTVVEGEQAEVERAGSCVFAIAGDLHGRETELDWLKRGPNGAAADAVAITDAVGRPDLRRAAVTPSLLAAFPMPDDDAALGELGRPWAEVAFSRAKAVGSPLFLAATETVRVV